MIKITSECFLNNSELISCANPHVTASSGVNVVLCCITLKSASSTSAYTLDSSFAQSFGSDTPYQFVCIFTEIILVILLLIGYFTYNYYY